MLTIPPNLADRQIRKAAEEVSRLDSERREAEAGLRTAEGTLRDIREADQRAYAAALRAGKDDPATKQERRAEEAPGKARRCADALVAQRRDAFSPRPRLRSASALMR